MPYNPVPFITPDTPPTAAPNWGSMFSDLIRVNLEKAKEHEQARQFGLEQQRMTDQAAAQIGMQQQQLGSENRRFATTQSNTLAEKDEADERKRYEAKLALAQQTRQLVAHGKYSEALANIGTLRDAGVDASASMDDKGNPVFHIAAPEYKGPKLDSSFSNQLNQVQPGAAQPSQPNPFDTRLGTMGSLMTSGSAPAAQAPAGPLGLPSGAPPTDAEKAPLQATPQETAALGGAPAGASPDPAAPAPPAPAQGTTPSGQAPAAAAHGSAGDLSASDMTRLNAAALAPVMEGINRSFVSRYQPNAEALTQGFTGLHDTPEGTLTAMAPVMKDAVSNWNAQMNAEGQMARASMQQGGQASSEDRQRENEAYNRAKGIGAERGLTEDVKAMGQFDEIRDKLSSGNRNSQADAIKQLIALHEGHRISNADFTIALNGVASNVEQLKLKLEQIYHDGLPLSTTQNFLKMLDLAQGHAKQRINDTQKQLMNFSSNFRNEPERYAVRQAITGLVPDNLLSDEMRTWDPSADQGGKPARALNNKTKKITATGRTTAEAVQGVKDVNAEADDLLK